jgi:type IV secretory pathway TrbD component
VTGIERHRIYLSLTRVVLLGGAPRSFVFFEGTLVAILVFGVGPHLPTLALAAFWLLLAHPLAVRLARREPQAVELYLRSLAWADFYPALSPLHARVRKTPSGLSNG